VGGGELPGGHEGRRLHQPAGLRLHWQRPPHHRASASLTRPLPVALAA
jgi:hypothetical protein